jgi:fermentation-respiration switch protein FrsA (DUF1100 family)
VDRLFSWLKMGTILGALVFVILCAALYLLQDRLIFLPDQTRIAPTRAGISVAEIKTRDGETLLAWYGEAAPGCPTLLHLHGNGGRIDLDVWRYERLMERGAGFLALSWRGYAGSSGQPSEAGFYKDADAAWEWLQAQGIPTGDVVVHGHSIGSGAAVKLAGEQPVGALVLEAPFYSMQDLVGRKVPLVPMGLLLKHKFRNDLRIGDVTAPVFMAHGTRDRVIPIEQSKRLFERAGGVKHHEVFEGGDHNTLVRDGLYDRVWPFLEAHWQASGAAQGPCAPGG